MIAEPRAVPDYTCGVTVELPPSLGGGDFPLVPGGQRIPIFVPQQRTNSSNFESVLLLQRRLGTIPILFFLVLSIGLRSYFWFNTGQVQGLAYQTIIGHFDQFLLGIAFFRASQTMLFANHGTKIFVAAFIALSAFWHLFNGWGGFYTSPQVFWIILPTIEGIAWGCVIAGYENARFRIPRIVDRTLARIGEVSYSIYLWHWPLLTYYAVHYVKFPSNFSLATVLAIIMFAPMVAIATLSFEAFERPFLRYRMRYTQPAAERSSAVVAEVNP